MTAARDARKFAPATERNREPILEVLQRVLPRNGNILEIASGTGEHAAFFAPYLRGCQWIPSDPNPELRNSINAWREYCSTRNFHPPLDINASDRTWQLGEYDSIAAIVNINMIHIAPWSACLGLMAGANRLLDVGGIVYLYGPYRQNDRHTAPSNMEFDRLLRDRNPDWGVRNLEDTIAAAEAESFKLLETVSMPANNLSVVFEKV